MNKQNLQQNSSRKKYEEKSFSLSLYHRH